jgi:intracellular septation protein
MGGLEEQKSTAPAPGPRRRHGWTGPVADFGPLAVFLGAYLAYGLAAATAALIAASTTACVLSYALTRRLPIMPLVAAVVVAIFGGLTLWFHDDTFIKLKPTIVQLLFAAVLLGGMALRRSPLRAMLGTAWPMGDAGWRRLTIRFAAFFLVMAGINEAVWRTQSTDTWVMFKVLALPGLTMLFALAQVPLLTRHRPESEPAAAGPDLQPPA